MTSLLLVCVGMMAVAAMTAVATMYMTATSHDAETSMVTPFGNVGMGCPANDTLVASVETTLNFGSRSRNWQMATLNSLSEAEDLLDSLENHNVMERELHVLADSAFVVRWKNAA